MSEIDPDIAYIYILALKYNMRIQDIPSAWFNVEWVNKGIDPDYPIEFPGYVKLILKYGTDRERLKKWFVDARKKLEKPE